ncbi:MAG: radical SAM protein [Holophaga sp.]|nr:radical SAM protein [Holophaga sp.]
MSEGLLFEIQRWSTDDGPGIRSTLFFQGCPLRCAWCCNPEAWQSGARPMAAEAILAQVERDRVFYRQSGGGVTFSGGEATAQPGLLLHLAQRLHGAGVHLALETCGHFPWAANAAALALMDLVYLDLKHMDSAVHARLTGVPNGLILENALRMAGLGIPMVLRVPLIPGRNDDPENLEATADFAARLGHPPMELMPYHRLGVGKHRELGLDYALEGLEPPSEAAVERARAVLRSRGARI